MKTFRLNTLTSFHRRYAAAAALLQHPLLLLIRLYWGFDFLQTGLGKLNHLERTTEFFASLNIPFPMFNAAAAGTTEIVCGTLLMLGLGARYFTLPLIVMMMIAYATDDIEALSGIFSDPEAFVAATPFQHLLSLLLVFTFGAGTLSLDALIERYFARKQ